MTKGSWICDDVSRHFGSSLIKASCSRCSTVDPETVRTAQPEPLRRTIPDKVLAKMCPDGRRIYRAYLRWLAEPDW